MISDKQTEKKRYNDRASAYLSEDKKLKAKIGSTTMPLFLRPPYQYYEKIIKEKISPENKVLELGSGSGLHTLCLVQTGADITASDISQNSLKVLQESITRTGHEITIKVADIEALPFDDNSFDVITSAGSLSYGNNETVMLESFRVLKDNGMFICVDSLNHNPIYKLNRWIHFLRGNRTKSTLKHMPTNHLIKLYGNKFGSIKTSYFGAMTWFAPILNKLFSEKGVTRFINGFDRMFSVKKSAFKFVMVVTKEKNE